MNIVLEELRKKIEKDILPLIDNDYIFYGLPFYSNIGDVLIWEGTRQLLSKSKYKCIGRYASSITIKKDIPKNVVIIIIGGGFFGDVWRKSFEYVLANISGKVDNKIIFLPNSLSYSDEKLLNHDIAFLNGFKNLYLCFRDKNSFEYAKTKFRNNVLLVPDMAFYINPDSLAKYTREKDREILLLQRNDREANEILDIEGADVHDWPTMEKLGVRMFLYKSMFKAYFILSSYKLFESDSLRRAVNYIGEHSFREYMLCTGVGFLSKYKYIISTRLHPMILAFLLGQEVSFIDNSYGKISNLYNTWLNESEIVSAYKKK